MSDKDDVDWALSALKCVNVQRCNSVAHDISFIHNQENTNSLVSVNYKECGLHLLTFQLPISYGVVNPEIAVGDFTDITKAISCEAVCYKVTVAKCEMV